MKIIYYAAYVIYKSRKLAWVFCVHIRWEKETYSAVCVWDCLRAVLVSEGRGSSWAGVPMRRHAFAAYTSAAHRPAMLFPALW